MEKCEIDAIDGDFPVLVYKKNECSISNFNQGVDHDKENSLIKSNQIGVFRDIGIIYCFDDKNIYFFTNSYLKYLIQDQKTISKEDMLIYSFEDKIMSAFPSEQFIYTLHIKDKNSIVNVFDIKDVINKRVAAPSLSFNYPFVIKDIQLLNYVSYTLFVVLNENKSLCIYDKENNISNLSSNCITFKVNQKGNKIIFVDNNIQVFTNTSTPQKLCSIPLSEVLLENEKIIFVDIVTEFIVLYGMDTNKEGRMDDKIHFIDINNKKVFTNENFEFPEEEEVSKFKYEPAIIGCYLEESEIYVICSKQYYTINTYFSITKDSVKQLMVEDDAKLTSLFKEQERNTLIAFNYIDFKFDGYNNESEVINSINFVTPPLGLLLNFDGRMRIYSFAQENQQFDLKELDYKWIADSCMGKSVKIAKKEIKKEEKKLFTKMDVLQNNIERKTNFIKEFDDKKSKEKVGKRNEEENKLRKEQLNVIRNRFIRKLKFQIQANLQILKDNSTFPNLDSKLQELNTTLDSFSKYSSNFTEVINKSKDFLNNKSTLYDSIQQSKDDIISFKNSIITLKSRKKEIENIVTKINNMNISDNASLEEILSSQLMEEFFGKDKCTEMINIFKEVNINYEIIQSQKELYSKLINIYNNFNTKLKNISKEYRKAVNYSKMLNKYSLNQANQINRKVFSEKTQNDMFVNYMKILEELLFDLVCFYESHLKEKIESLQNKKQNQIIKLNHSAMMLPYKSKINELNLFEMTTLAKKNNIVTINPIEKLNKILINGKCSVTYPDKTEAINIEEFFTGKVTEKEEEKEKEISIEKLNEIENLEKEMKKIEEQNKKNKEETEKYIEEMKMKKKKQKDWEESVEKRIDDINKMRKNNIEINKQNEQLYKFHKDMIEKGKETASNLKAVKEQFDKEKKKSTIQTSLPSSSNNNNLFNTKKDDFPKTNLFGNPSKETNKNLFPFQQQNNTKDTNVLVPKKEETNKKEETTNVNNKPLTTQTSLFNNKPTSATNPFVVNKNEKKQEEDKKEVKQATSIFGNMGLGDANKDKPKEEEKPKTVAPATNPFVKTTTQPTTVNLFGNQPQSKPSETKPTISNPPTENKPGLFSTNTPTTTNIFTSTNTLSSTAKPTVVPPSNPTTTTKDSIFSKPLNTTNPIQPNQNNTNPFAQKGITNTGSIFSNQTTLSSLGNLGQINNPIPQAQNTNPIQQPSFGGVAKLGGNSNPFGAPITTQPSMFSFGSHISNPSTTNATTSASPFANPQPTNASPFSNPQPTNASPFANPQAQSGFGQVNTNSFFNTGNNNMNNKPSEDYF